MSHEDGRYPHHDIHIDRSPPEPVSLTGAWWANVVTDKDEAVLRLLEQIALSDFTDEHRHKLKNNVAYLALVEAMQ